MKRFSGNWSRTWCEPRAGGSGSGWRSRKWRSRRDSRRPPKSVRSSAIACSSSPTIRARLARELLRTHKMKQIDVAHSMGITQAAVSHYNTQSRGVDQEMVHLFPEIKPFVHGLAESIAGGMTLSQQIASVNQFCSNLMLTARFCEYHKGMGAIDPHCTSRFPSPPSP